MDRKKPIIALDFKSTKEVRSFLNLFMNKSLNVKIGMELFYSAGPDIVREVIDAGHSVFLDLKLYDIPNTVENAMTQLAGLGVSMINVHASGGVDMMIAAKKGLIRGTPAGKEIPILIGVTQLTSRKPEINEAELQLAVTQEESILSLAKLTQASKLDGVVCSAHESHNIHQRLGSEFLTVTPGIRLSNHQEGQDDQVRITTPKKAAEYGCDYIVVGRPITKSNDPVKKYDHISKEWQDALGGRK